MGQVVLLATYAGLYRLESRCPRQQRDAVGLPNERYAAGGHVHENADLIFTRIDSIAIHVALTVILVIGLYRLVKRELT
jgi:hypothetical protein